MNIKIPKGAKLTPLFPMTAKPSRVGVYAVYDTVRNNTSYSMWTGKHWNMLSWSPRSAHTRDKKSGSLYSRNRSAYVWCGLTEEQK